MEREHVGPVGESFGRLGVRLHEETVEADGHAGAGDGLDEVGTAASDA